LVLILVDKGELLWILICYSIARYPISGYSNRSVAISCLFHFE
jgi:hypothetical protein